MIALLENGQQDDGTVAIPEVLQQWGAPGGAAGRGRVMSETPITPEDPDIPDEPPPAEDGSPELDDQPLGPPAEMPEEDAPLPGLPEREPPAAD